MKTTLIILSTLAFGVILSQFPEFYQQYTQRVGGHLDGVKLQVADLDQRAASINKNRFEYIRRLLKNKDAVVQNEGHSLVRLLGSEIKLQSAFDSLNEPVALWRSARFVQHFDKNIAIATLNSYRPAIPLTVEGLAYFCSGAVLGWLSVLLASMLFRNQENQRN